MITNVSETKTKLAYSVAEASEVTSISKSYLRNAIRAKNLKAKLVGSRVLILDADLQNWLQGKENWKNSDERKTNEVKK